MLRDHKDNKINDKNDNDISAIKSRLRRFHNNMFQTDSGRWNIFENVLSLRRFVQVSTIFSQFTQSTRNFVCVLNILHKFCNGQS